MPETIDLTRISDGEYGSIVASGFQPIKQEQNIRRLAAAAKLYSDVLHGRQPRHLLAEAMNPTHEVYVAHIASQYPDLYGHEFRLRGLRESMSNTDYKALFADVLDREYLGYYNDWPIDMWRCVKRHTCTDTRVVRRYLYDGDVEPWVKVAPAAPAPQAALTGPVPQGGATPATADTAALEYQPAFYKAGSSIDFNAALNDDLGIFRDIPKRLAMRGTRGTSRFISEFFWDANGPNTNLYKAGFRNLISTAYGASSTNPALNAQGLQDGFTVLMNMVDDVGEPILVGNSTVFLVYSRTEYVTVENLMNTLQSNISVTGGTQDGTNGFPAYQLVINNWMKAKIVPIMDPYLNLIATNRPHSWGLVVDPSMLNRPPVEIGQVKGFDTPQIFQRVPNIQRLGGGLEVQMGNYDTLRNDLMVLGNMGGTWIDGRGTVASNASGS